MSDYTVGADGCWELVIVSHSMSPFKLGFRSSQCTDANCQAGPENLLTNTETHKD